MFFLLIRIWALCLSLIHIFQPGGFTKKLLLNLAEDKDIIYLTSFYAEYGYKTLLLKKEKKIQSPVVIASMGVFSKEALAQKSLKKNVFIAGCKMLHLFNQTTWSVTSELAAEDVKRVMGEKSKYIVAEDLPSCLLYTSRCV